ncbi:MAG: exodeoxyribonuclease VII large subunit, partial [Puniceicoccaceae bacterium]
MRDFFLPPLEREHGGPAGEPESVSGLTARIRETLVREIGAVWVRGEISNLRQQSSGHVYFSLKDETSQVAAV